MNFVEAFLLGIILFHKDYDKFYEDYWEITGYFESNLASFDRCDWLNTVRQYGWEWA
jgi:hypothetical protein